MKYFLYLFFALGLVSCEKNIDLHLNAVSDVLVVDAQIENDQPPFVILSKSFDYFARTTKDNQDLQKFAIKIKEVYDYFEQKKKLPLISVNKKGDYVVM